MSVSLVLIPAVLLIRMAMGKEKFVDWVESSQIKIPTNIKNEDELVRVVQSAGYDANKYGALIKTHFIEQKNFFFWEKINGVWNAVFTKSDSSQMIGQLFNNLEKKSGRQLVTRPITELDGISPKDELKNNPESLKKPEKKTFPTNFVDEKLLLKTINEFGISYSIEAHNKIVCIAGNCKLIFHKEGTSGYDVDIEGATSLKDAYQYLSNLDEQYKTNVQEYTYHKVISKLKQTNMFIESEEVLEDNSILLTISI